MPPHILAESGFLSLLHADILCTTLKSTLRNTDSTDSHIYYVGHSLDLRSILNIFPIIEVPWSPHFAFGLSVLAKPRQMVSRVLVVPKTLPVEDFGPKWDGLNQFQQLKQFRIAQRKARR